MPNSTVGSFAAARGTAAARAATGPVKPSAVPCDYSDPNSPCSGTGGDLNGGLLLPSGKGLPECNTTYHTGAPLTDRDRDGWDDGCEYELAYAFRPTQALSYADCDYTSEPYWAATGGNHSGQIKIFYALSYHQDCGTPFLNLGITSHLGDSEFFVAYVDWISDAASTMQGKWRLDHVFFSAHWHEISESDGYYDGADLEYSTTFRGRPRIWVAEGKHGSYRSQAVCNAGAYYTDSCVNNTDFGASPQILQAANLGQSSAPFLGSPVSAVASRFGNPTKYPGTEWFWTNDTFCGWYPRGVCGSGGGPYRESLTAFGF